MTPSPRAVQAALEWVACVLALAGIAATMMLFFPRKQRRG